MECKVCNKDFDTDNKFHRHLKKCSGLSQAEYYETYFPRYDLGDNSLIRYKDKRQYFSTQFNTKASAISWYKAQSLSEEGRAIAIKELELYFKSKEFAKAPSQVELRCKKIPSIIGIESLGISYPWFCKELNLPITLTNRIVPHLNDVNILTDTREQKPVFTDHIEKLEVRDYTTSLNFSGVFIERKSLEDFIGTLTRKENFDRFEEELKRAEELGLYIVVLCEADFESVISWKNPHAYGRSCGYSGLTKMCEFLQKYNHCQFLFLKKGRSMRKMIDLILGMGTSVKTTDLQLIHDLNLI